MKLTVLGTATPYPRPDNACSGQLLQHGETAVWVDAGTGTLAELQRHIRLDELSAIWISHAHADHTADLLTAYYALRFADIVFERPLPLICPPGLRDRLAAFLGPSAVKNLPKVFDFITMKDWGDHRIGPLDLSWGPVDHGMPAFALRASADGTSIAYSGDTAYCTSLVEIAERADLLVCEVGYAEHPAEQRVHCTPEDAGRAAREAGVPVLALTHIDNALTSAEAVARAGSVYEGAVIVAQPGETLIEIGPSA
jgi:ribonuclease BN (tRNA processing enzyme)